MMPLPAWGVAIAVAGGKIKKNEWMKEGPFVGFFIILQYIVFYFHFALLMIKGKEGREGQEGGEWLGCELIPSARPVSTVANSAMKVPVLCMTTLRRATPYRICSRAQKGYLRTGTSNVILVERRKQDTALRHGLVNCCDKNWRMDCGGGGGGVGGSVQEGKKEREKEEGRKKERKKEKVKLMTSWMSLSCETTVSRLDRLWTRIRSRTTPEADASRRDANAFPSLAMLSEAIVELEGGTRTVVYM